MASFQLMPFTRVKGICPSCEAESTFQYLGIQEDEDDVPGMTLWNCQSCCSTISGRHILPERLEALIIELCFVPHMGATP